jgi:hypothetical protein
MLQQYQKYNSDWEHTLQHRKIQQQHMITPKSVAQQHTLHIATHPAPKKHAA